MTQVLLPSQLRFGRGVLYQSELKCRLERMDRRMSLLKQRGGSSDKRGSSAAAPPTTEILSNSAPLLKTSSRGSQDGFVPSSRGYKRKGSLEPQSLAKKFSSSSGAAQLPQLERLLPGSHHTPRKTTLQKMKSEFGLRHFTRTPLRVNIEALESDSDLSSKNQSPSSRRKAELYVERGILDSVKERLKAVCLPTDVKDEYFQRTDVMYYIPWEVPIVPCQRISPKKKDTAVMVPSFREKIIPTGYSMEGTENLDDEIFLKRHQKPEAEEKRRKRWDMQRMREQRLYEKLQGKMQKQQQSEQRAVSTESFIPDPDDVKYIEICDNVPVSAFGYPVPEIHKCNFHLPNFDLDKQDRDEHKKGARKKK